MSSFRSDSSAAETVANIEELLTKILVSVPPRSVARFKCVSKHWLTLISDPGFFRRHTHQNSKISGFFSSKTEDKSFKSIPLGNGEIPSGNPFKIINDKIVNNFDGDRLKIIQSCNGLFLCLRYHWDPKKQRYPGYVSIRYAVNNAVYVVNPTTNQFLALSSPSAEDKKQAHFMVRYALAFEPSISPYYKVVCVTNFWPYAKSGHHQIDIYSSETGEWKKLLRVPFFPSPSDERRDLYIYEEKKFPMHFDCRSREGAVYCNGKIHWIRCTKTVRYLHNLSCSDFSCCHFRNGRLIRDEGDVLHYFDIDEQSLRLVAATPPVPVGVEAESQVVNRYFGECCGHLYLIEFYKHYDTHFDIMEMERDYSGWFVKYHVDLNRVIAALPWKALVVLFISRGEEKDHKVDDSSTDLWLHMPGKVISYNLRNKTFKTSVEFANKKLFLASDDDDPYFRDDEDCPYMETLAYPYMETLASL